MHPRSHRRTARRASPGQVSPLTHPGESRIHQDFNRYALEHTQFGATAELTPLLADALAGLTEPARIMDVGCGEGGTLQALRGTAGTLFGIELSHVRARIARDRHHDVVVADGLHLPCADGAMSLLISRHVLEHVPDDTEALQEMRRVLRPGGRLYLETPLRLPGAWYFYRRPDGRRALDPTHVREYRTIEELTAVVQAAGFHLVNAQLHPIRFPIGELLARPLRHVLPRGGVPKRVLRTRLALRVPRYREIRLLAEATNPPTNPALGRPPRTVDTPSWQ